LLIVEHMMKRWLVCSGLGVFLAGSVLGQTAQSWVNNSSIICPPEIPPVIDAFNFVNNRSAIISLTFTNADYLPLFDTTSTLNFTNHGYMSANTGFRFDTEPAAVGQRTWARSFFNDGTIDSGTATNPAPFTAIFFSGNGARTFLAATNIINPGTLNMGFESLLNVVGAGIDFRRTLITSETSGFSTGGGGFFFFNQGFFDGYWGADTNVMNPGFQFGFPPPQSPFSLVLDRNYNTRFQVLGGTPDFVSYLSDVTDASGSNRLVRAVFLRNTNAQYTVNVYFPPGPPFPGDDIEVEWISRTTNIVGQVQTNYIYLFDSFGANTNFGLAFNGTAGPRPTFIPVNYTFIVGGPFTLGTPETPATITPATFDLQSFTNQYSAYEALFFPATRVVSDVVGQNITNLPGRIEINATEYLDMTLGRIEALNYLKINATNSYGGNNGGLFSAPFMDVFLRSTNGVLAITNLIAPTVPRPEGTIELWSGRWTNEVAGVTNAYHVLFVDSQLSPTFPPRIQDTVLISTNIDGSGPGSLIINDVLTILRNSLFDAASITIASNSTGAGSLTGGLNFLNDTIWPTIAPRLEHLTNNGFITGVNAIYFGGKRASPYYTSNFDEPYIDFINTGSVTNFGSEIWALNFVNSGYFVAQTGPIELHGNRKAILTKGGFITRGGDITIESSILQVSNHVLLAGGAITLAVNNYLDDGSLSTGSADLVTNRNFWTTGFGFNLLQKPDHGSLLATTISNRALPFQRVINRWAADDRGPNPQGFIDNSAIGDVILNGGTNSVFEFAPVTGNNAIYIDRLELNGSTGASDALGRFGGVRADPGMKVYYGEAVANGVEISEKLTQTPGFVWVTNFNCGVFSSTNLIYLDGSTNRVNRGLAAACDIDSNGNGIMNCSDPAPIPAGLTGCQITTTPIPVPSASSGGSTDGGNGSGSGSTSGNLVKNLNYPGVASPAGAVFTNALATAKGTYNGLISSTNGVTVESCGYISVVLTDKGTFSAKVTLAGKTQGLSGKFNASGAAHTVIARAGASPLTLDLQLGASADGQLVGTVTASGWTADVLADRQSYSKANPAPQAGIYTLIIPGNLPGSSAPGGDSIGTLKIDALGNVLLSGALADGSKLNQKTTISKQGIWPLYAPLYNGKGLLASWVQLQGQPTQLNAQVLWIKMQGAVSKNYPAGFTNQAELIGSRYSRSKSAASQPVTGQFIVQGGGLSHPVTNSVVITADGKISAPRNSNLKVSVATGTGLFQGTVTDAQSHKVFPFQGVLLPDSDFGAGFFLNNELSGEVYLSPAP
jgi:hypothetical protein